MSQLTVYKASAGSGKTYKLTEEYLTLLFSNELNYKHILALTFTNKAAGEMKNRIIHELSRLANEEESSYRDTLASRLNLSYNDIKTRSSHLLNSILHDFSRFAIGTIDSFFQKVFRVFVRELRLHIGYNLEFDTDMVLQHAIDKLFFDLHENKTLCNWLSEFAFTKIEEGGSWNIEKNILTLGNEVFKEGFKLFDPGTIQLLQDKSFMKTYVAKVYQYKNVIENKLSLIGNESKQFIGEHGLEIEDFAYGMSGIAGIFYKYSDKNIVAPSLRVIGGVDNPSNWYTKTSQKKNEIEHLVISFLNEKLKAAIENFQLLATVTSVLKNIYTLGILTDISNRIIEFSNEQNRFVLNDITKLLYSIIGGNDSPFIYEKLGSYYRHIMIDEFQDTSQMQWMNLKPLVADTLSEDHKSLVIGDIKQSIYRWRNSDWSIMAENLPGDFNIFGIKEETLHYNWRSKTNIILFNNALFKNASSILQNEFNQQLKTLKPDDSFKKLRQNILQFYADVEQKIPQGKENSGGHVNIARIPGKDPDETINNILKTIPGRIEQLEDCGYRAGDIAILVRNKAEGKQVADYLIDYKHLKGSDCTYNYDFISNETLFLESSRAVQIITGIFKYLVSPEDKPNAARINYLASVLDNSLPSNPGEWHHLFETAAIDGQDFMQLQLGKPSSALTNLTTYELTEFIIRTLNLHSKTEELPFLETFLDSIFTLGQEENASLHYILEWWEEKGKKETVKFSGFQDAIQIITIHKSKGLEFKAVIIPFCNWPLDHKKSPIIWCKPPIAPINELPEVPIAYTSSLKNTLFAPHYFDEMNRSYIDNLNILYVAFTRACDALYVMLPFQEKEKETKINTTAQLVLNTILQDPQLSQFWDNEKGLLTWGKLTPKEQTKEETGLNTYELLKHISCNITSRLALRYNSSDFLPEKKDLFSDKINYGKIMHELFAKITTENDIERVLNSYKMEGKLSGQEVQTIRERTKQLFKNEQVKNWFSPVWKVKTEAAILDKGGRIRRPDRVMMGEGKTIVVDYKFGQTEQLSHKKQVVDYMNYIIRMGYEQLEGYIWYVDQNVVITC